MENRIRLVGLIRLGSIRGRREQLRRLWRYTGDRRRQRLRRTGRRLGWQHRARWEHRDRWWHRRYDNRWHRRNWHRRRKRWNRRQRHRHRGSWHRRHGCWRNGPRRLRRNGNWRRKRRKRRQRRGRGWNEHRRQRRNRNRGDGNGRDWSRRLGGILVPRRHAERNRDRRRLRRLLRRVSELHDRRTHHRRHGGERLQRRIGIHVRAIDGLQPGVQGGRGRRLHGNVGRPCVRVRSRRTRQEQQRARQRRVRQQLLPVLSTRVHDTERRGHRRPHARSR